MAAVTIASEQDVADFIEADRPAGSRMRWVWVLGLGGVFFEAYANAALSAGLGPLTDELGLAAGEVGLLAGSSMLVALVLGPVAGLLADRLGRVPMLVAAKVVALLSAIIASTSSDLALLLLGRGLAGVAWAFDFAVVMAYLAEFLPTRKQSKLNRWQGIWYVATTCNLLITVAIYQAGVGQSIWRWSLASAGLIAAVLGVLQVFLLSESPRWLASKGRFDKAARTLREIYGVDVVAGSATAAPARPRESSLGDISQLLRRPYRRRTVLAVVTFFCQGLEYFAIGWYLPVISLQLFGDDFTAAALGATLFNVFGIVGGFASGVLAQRFTIRRTMLVGFALAAVVLILLGVLFDGIPLWLAFTLPALFLLLHSGGPAPGGISLAAAAYPSNLRALGSGVTNMAGSTGGVVGSFVFPLVLDALGAGPAIVVMAAIPLTGFLTSLLIRWDPERDQRPSDARTAETISPAPGT
ncbi:sugar porter family MFS transporter [Saccharopolyspora sp. K220]|uniref:MFS transporter n=1 Tax=Saccharopolyspora soli TaxID=2926618 RepID=UPI001F5A38E7|nr:MFS transporter [Saccharopolyspora soli]MCI2415930.1 sugar porter family MFS transporter [Saccharopolyspora soli]